MQAGIGGVTGVLQLVGIRGADKALKAITNTVGKYAAKYAIETATDTASDVLKQVFIEKKELSWQMLGSSAASSLLSNAGGDLLKGGFGKLSKKLDLDKVDNKLFKAGTEFATDTIADTAIDVADKTLIKGEEFSLGMLGESAGTSALGNLAAAGANKLYGDKLRSLGHDKSKVDNNNSKPKDLTDTSPEVDNNTSKPKDLTDTSPEVDNNTSKPKDLTDKSPEVDNNTSKPKDLTDKSPEVDNNTSKPKNLTDNDDHRNKQLTPERKAELEQKLENRTLTKEEWKELDRDRRISEKQNQNNTESSTPQKINTDGNERTHHKDQPEIEPGIVAKEKTADGHEIKVLKDGRVVRCSDCAEIKIKYKEQLEKNEKLGKRLKEIEKIENADEKARQAQELEKELQAAAKKRTVEPDSTEEDNSSPSKKPKDWNGSKEAESRGYLEAEPGYVWVLDQNGNLRHDRRSVVGSDGKPIPQRAYDPVTHQFVDVDTNVTPASYKSADSEKMKILEDKKPDYEKLLDARDDATSRRDKLSKELGSTDNKELKARREDLEKLKKENPDKFTKEKQAELDKINERSRTLSEINEQSRKLGEKASESYVKSKYPEAELVYGGPNANSQSGDFDQVWRVPAKNSGESDTWIVIEAKGGSGSLGTRKVNGGTEKAQQGSRPYFEQIVDIMSNNPDPKAKAIGRELGKELRQDNQSSIKYMEVRAPIKTDSSGNAQLQDIQIKEFDISSP
jgi:hypothetical protein